MDADRNTHEHLLWALHDLLVHPEEVGLLECLKTKVVVIEVTIIAAIADRALVEVNGRPRAQYAVTCAKSGISCLHEGSIQSLSILHDNLVHVVCNQGRRLLISWVDVTVQLVHRG